MKCPFDVPYSCSLIDKVKRKIQDSLLVCAQEKSTSEADDLAALLIEIRDTLYGAEDTLEEIRTANEDLRRNMLYWENEHDKLAEQLASNAA
jgi:hypothetical protein